VNVETLANWSEPKELDTRNGRRLLRKALPTPEFSTAWRADKEGLKELGLAWSKDRNTGEWEVCWWIDPAKSAAKVPTVPMVVSLTPEQESRLAEIAPKLLPYQVESVRRTIIALTRFGGALDASDTGTGKTFVALAACAVLNLPVYVVCPKAVVPSWKRAAMHFGIEVEACNYELLRRGEQEAVKIIGEGKKEHFEWNLPAGTVLIFDECHKLKDYKTQNHAMGMAAIRQGYKVLGLSATAADNPIQMKFAGLLTKCFPAEKAYWGWMLRNGVTRGRFGLEFNGGNRALHSIHKQIFPDHGTRLRIADLGDAFPETQIAAEAYDLNGASEKISAIYDEMAEAIARIEASEQADKGACILVEQLRARQRAEVLKIPAVAEMAANAVEEGLSVAIFVNFDDSADALAEKLKTKCCIRGGQSAEERERCIAGFQSDKEHVIICNIKAGGVGVSLHGSPTARMRLAIICPTFSGQDLKQALGRVWRANGAKSIQRIFFSAGTIEETVCQQVKAKIARIDTLNDGDMNIKGVENVPTTAQDAPEGQKAIITPHSNQNAPNRSQEPVVSEAQKHIIHGWLRLLAGMDVDRARDVNGIGFNGVDSDFGHKLAEQTYLTDRQAIAAAKMCRKYGKQLGVDVAEEMRGVL